MAGAPPLDEHVSGLNGERLVLFGIVEHSQLEARLKPQRRGMLLHLIENVPSRGTHFPAAFNQDVSEGPGAGLLKVEVQRVFGHANLDERGSVEPSEIEISRDAVQSYLSGGTNRVAI
jgi:hypothetical protein